MSFITEILVLKINTPAQMKLTSGIFPILLLVYVFLGNDSNIHFPSHSHLNGLDAGTYPMHQQSKESNFEPLFNGINFEGWYTFIPEFGKNNDPDLVFSVVDSMVYVTGQYFGYIATEKVYHNYHLKLEFKWGEKKWPPRLNQKRDSGICYHFGEDIEDSVWPKSVECQIQEGDTGDFWLIGQTTIKVDGKTNEPENFARIIKKRDHERANGEWNTVEVISYEGTCTHLVNGVVVNHGENASVQSGRILLQSEGAEIYFRNIRLKVL